jgi:dUTP pyrophosphatase
MSHNNNERPYNPHNVLESLPTKPTIKFKKIVPEAVIPEYQTKGAAGMDLVSMIDIYLRPGDRALIKTGIAVELPQGYEGQVRSRSGLSLKQGLVVLNSPGTIDEDYRGEIGVIIHNVDFECHQIKKGDKIAQLVINKVEKFPIEVVTELTNTDRGSGGFGSTGK